MDLMSSKELIMSIPLWPRILIFIGIVVGLWFVFFYPVESKADKTKSTPNAQTLNNIKGDYVQGNKVMNVNTNDNANVIKEFRKFMGEWDRKENSRGKLISPVSDINQKSYTVIFGNNRFEGVRSVLMVADVPLVTMRVEDNKFYINAAIYDQKEQVMALIRDNNWYLETDKKLRKEIGINSLKVWDENNNLLLDCKLLSDHVIKLNGIFRYNGTEIKATDSGIEISGRGGYGLGGM